MNAALNPVSSRMPVRSILKRRGLGLVFPPYSDVISIVLLEPSAFLQYFLYAFFAWAWGGCVSLSPTSENARHDATRNAFSWPYS